MSEIKRPGDPDPEVDNIVEKIVPEDEINRLRQEQARKDAQSGKVINPDAGSKLGGDEKEKFEKKHEAPLPLEYRNEND